MLVAQISDPHLSTPEAELFGGYLPDFAFARVLERVASLVPRPDFVWLTGDLTDQGSEAEYRNLRSRLAGFDLPAAAIPGNHDRRAAFAEGLAGTGVRTGAGAALCLAVETYPVRMIGLDTLVEGSSAGRIGAEQLAWLDARLAEAPERPTMLFMHHPPFRTGIAFSDATCCADAAALAAVLARHPAPLLIGCGHVHRAVQARFAGVIASTCPSVCWALRLDLAPGARLRVEPQAPGFQLHLWEPGAGLVSHTEFLQDW